MLIKNNRVERIISLLIFFEFYGFFNVRTQFYQNQDIKTAGISTLYLGVKMITSGSIFNSSTTQPTFNISFTNDPLVGPTYGAIGIVGF